MSKVSFRTRQIDFNRPLPIVKHDSAMFYELGESTFVNRGVPHLPSGMEREEENEHHFMEVLQDLQLQKSSGIIIPVPEIIDKIHEYTKLYSTDFSPPKHLIHMRTMVLADDEPINYDMDTDDEDWLRRSELNLPAEKFESMIDRLEKGCGQKVMNLEEARLLLNDDPSLVIAVYDYWLNKRVQCRQPLLLSVRQEKRDGGSNNDPYVAFRRRTERMQTRKNRKNDEYSYEKMLILREQISALGEIMSRLVKRETTKETLINKERDIFQLRYTLNDWEASHLSEADAIAHKSPKSFERVLNHNFRRHSPRKRKISHRTPDISHVNSSEVSEEESTSPREVNPFTFIRVPGCKYQRPIDLRKAEFPSENHDCYRLSTVPHIQHSRQTRYTGYLRRRVGRGGRFIIDRISPPSEDLKNHFLHFDTACLFEDSYKMDTRRWVPQNNYSENLNNEILTDSQHFLNDINRSQDSKISRCLFLSLIKRQPDHILSQALSNLSSISHSRTKQINLLSLHSSISSPKSNFNLIPPTLTKHLFTAPTVVNTRKGYSSKSNELTLKTSANSRPICLLSSEASLKSGKELATSSSAFTNNVKLINSGSENQLQSAKPTKGYNRTTSSEKLQLAISYSEINGSKRDHDDFNWLPHKNSSRKSTECLNSIDDETGKQQNGIIAVNPLLYKI